MRFVSLVLFAAVVNAGTYEQFQDPPKTYSVRPFWFWNGKLDDAELERQIAEMTAQHVWGAYAHSRTGLQTPYLGDEYFAVFGKALEAAQRRGFLFGFVDEYEWPGGEARDPWSPGLGSRVIAKDPAFRMRSLWFSSDGKAGKGDVQFAVAARFTSDDALDASTLTLVERPESWKPPAAGWRLLTYYLEPSQGRDGGLVDLLNKDAIRTWLDLVHERYYRLAPNHFGSTIDSIFSDHEGDIGRRIAWTPALFGEFRRSKGYDLRTALPLLSFEGGKHTPKVRCDYLDVVSELYAQSYMRQVTDWCARHHIKLTGHVWEENLISEAFSVGDVMRVERNWSWPGADSLHDLGRSPRDLKTTASVAHFENARFMVENQGLQGSDSYLDLEKMRLGTNMLGVWGVNVFVPHAFNYNQHRIEFPSDWFFHQPWWKYFHHYADYARRISFMNDGGRHVADILLFQPTETVWANAQPNYAPRPDWEHNLLPEINRAYGDLMNRMAQELRDFDVADSHYLDNARVENGTLRIGNESYRALVLPPLTAVRRSTMRAIESFAKAGGIVIAAGRLPSDSMDAGRDDPEVMDAAQRVFGAGGKGRFIGEDLEALFPILDAGLPRDIGVTGGTRKGWGGSHRTKEGLHYYWLVNDTDQPRHQTFRLKSSGVPEKWDAATGKRVPLVSRTAGGFTEVDLDFAGWDAFYVVFGNPDAKVAVATAAPRPRAERLIERWTLTPERKTMEAPYGLRFTATWDGLGLTRGFAERDFDDSRWTDTWLSRERWTVRDWLLAGPFDNVDHAGCYGAFAPERDAEYSRWKRHRAQAMAVDLYAALGLAPGSDGTAYAMTYVYSPAAQRVQLRVAANNNAHLWVNGEKLLDWHLHPWYYEMREDFALTRETGLKAGWNRVLVKVSRFRRGAFAFMLRITDAQGDPVDGVVVSADKTLPQPSYTYATAWYRIPVPATATGVKLPRFRRPVQIFYNGAPLAADGVFPAPAEGAGNVLAISMFADDDLTAAPVFTLGSAPARSGSWIDTGLPYYSGGATYESTFELTASDVQRGVRLDLGEVGVVAEVKVNGQAAGERVWRPFTFDLSGLVKPGTNRIAVTVTNTMENERAVLDRANRLPRLRHSGLGGPVKLHLM